MRTRHADRLWIVGGLVAAAALVALGWLFLIGPQHSETASLEEQAATAQTRATVQQQRLVQLRGQQNDLPRYEAQLAKDRKALPATSGVPDFLRQLQSAGETTGVAVSGVVVDRPAEVPGTQTTVYALPIGLTARGSAAELEDFLQQLQQVQPRAVLVTNVSAEATDPTKSFAGGVTARISLRAFVAPSIGTG